MNILILTPSYPDKKNIWSGVFFQEQAKALSKRHNVFVVSSQVDYGKFSPCFNYKLTKTKKNNLVEYIIYVSRSLPIYNQFNFLATTYFIIKKLFKNQKIDIIHCHFAYPPGIIGYFLMKHFNVPYVITEHASNFENRFKTFVHKRLVLKALKNAEGIIAVGQSLKHEINKYTSKQIRVVPNVIDISKFKLKINKGKFINIGFLGQLNDHRKGLDILLKAITKIKYQNYLLHIGGGGKLLEEYKSLANKYNICNKCKFYGVISPNKITDFFSKLDVFVLPSRKESFGVVVIEAMATGIPVIGTICGGPEDIITKETGILIEKENILELTNTIDFVLENLESYNSKKIRRYVNDNYGVNSFVKNLTGIYGEVLKNYEAKIND